MKTIFEISQNDIIIFRQKYRSGYLHLTWIPGSTIWISISLIIFEISQRPGYFKKQLLRSRIWISTRNKGFTRIFVSKFTRTFYGYNLSMNKLPTKVKVWKIFFLEAEHFCIHFFNIRIHFKKSLRYTLYQSIKSILKSEKK